jgi:hypothetical protein
VFRAPRRVTSNVQERLLVSPQSVTRYDPLEALDLEGAYDMCTMRKFFELHYCDAVSYPVSYERAEQGPAIQPLADASGWPLFAAFRVKHSRS